MRSARSFWIENAPAPKPWFHLYLEGVSAGPVEREGRARLCRSRQRDRESETFRLGFDGHNMATSFAGFDFANGQSLVQNSDAIPDRLEVDPEQRIYSLVTPHTQTLEFFPAANVFTAVKRIREQDTRRRRRVSRNSRDASRSTSGQDGTARAPATWNAPPSTGSRTRWWSGTTGSGGATITACPTSIRPTRNSARSRSSVNSWQRASATARSSRRTTTTSISIPISKGSRYDSIVFRQNGTPYRAWFNYGREAQSYRARPDRLLPYVERNVRLIKDGFAPDGVLHRCLVLHGSLRLLDQ